MKHKFDTRVLSSLFLLGFSAATLSGAALAEDFPKRKSGLWEINMHMDGVPNMGAIQQCIDQNTDNLMQQDEKSAKSDCSELGSKRQGNKLTVHSVCKFGSSIATTDAVFVGSFDASYKGDIKSVYKPPLYGKSESRVSIDAKWLSPCRAGQKPGDVILPKGKEININEMMSDPKIQEMMKRQK